MDIHAREERYQEIDKLEEKIMAKIEEMLLEHPARSLRRREGDGAPVQGEQQLRVRANEFDRELAAKRDSIRIEGMTPSGSSHGSPPGNP